MDPSSYPVNKQWGVRFIPEQRVLVLDSRLFLEARSKPEPLDEPNPAVLTPPLGLFPGQTLHCFCLLGSQMSAIPYRKSGSRSAVHHGAAAVVSREAKLMYVRSYDATLHTILASFLPISLSWDHRIARLPACLSYTASGRV